MGFRQNFKKALDRATGKENATGKSWDMSTSKSREAQVIRDYGFAKAERQEQAEKWKELNRYYNCQCYSQEQLVALAQKYDWSWVPPSLTDGFIQVESQIDDTIPQPQFKGRDHDLDSVKAKEREEVCNYVWYNNKLRELNLDNERALNELGNAFWKLAWDPSIKGQGYQGDIVIGNPDPAEIFPQPGAYDIEDCEWIIHAYRWHRRKARRFFGSAIDKLLSDSEHGDTEIYDTVHRTVDDDTLRIIEYWYKDDEGDIACSIMAGDREVKHIPKFWENTRHSGNQIYPFVKYCKIPVRKSFWDRGEIETVKDLIDAANREFFTALLNDMFMANDIVVREEGALVSDASVIPGAHWVVKPGQVNNVRRLGGVSNAGNQIALINLIKDKIEETNGNWASSQGVEPIRVTTASGIAQLNERADRRSNIKKAGRTEGFCRLAELTDWMALEFYNQDRIILIRGKKEGEEDQTITFNSENHRIPQGYEVLMDEYGEPLMDEYGEPIVEATEFYYPTVDVEVTAGEGIAKSKAFTLAATQELAGMPINPENAGIVLSIIDLLDLPNKEDVKQWIMDAIISKMQPPQQQQPPQQPGMGGTGDPVQDLLAGLSPEEQQMFMQLPPEQQEAMIMQALGGMPGV